MILIRHKFTACAAALITMLAACTSATTTMRTLGEAGESPGEITCKGKAVVSIMGSAGPTAGVNGSITAECSPDGASIRWGPPSTTAAGPTTP